MFRTGAPGTLKGEPQNFEGWYSLARFFTTKSQNIPPPSYPKTP